MLPQRAASAGSVPRMGSLSGTPQPSAARTPASLAPVAASSPRIYTPPGGRTYADSYRVDPATGDVYDEAQAQYTFGAAWKRNWQYWRAPNSVEQAHFARHGRFPSSSPAAQSGTPTGPSSQQRAPAGSSAPAMQLMRQQHRDAMAASARADTAQRAAVAAMQPSCAADERAQLAAATELSAADAATTADTDMDAAIAASAAERAAALTRDVELHMQETANFHAACAASAAEPGPFTFPDAGIDVADVAGPAESADVSMLAAQLDSLAEQANENFKWEFPNGIWIH